MEPILRMEDIHKSFPGVKALSGVSLNVYEGQVMALLGENGAGKSTLMKVLTGVYKKDSGKVTFEGKEVAFANSREANNAGIAIIHQELNLIPHMRVYENIFLGRELKNKLGTLDKAQMIARSKELLGSIGIDLDPTVKMYGLSIALQQMVEIAKALSLNSKIIVMDEPTDALPDNDVANLFGIIRKLQAQKKGIVYISHRLKEVFEICDKATILRDGTFIAQKDVSELNEESLITMMVGRTLAEQFPHVEHSSDEVVLSVKGLSNDLIHDISFELKKGEIVGIAGLVGAGRTELAKTLYGFYPRKSGVVSLLGKPIQPTSPRQAIEQGICYITEDRKRDGLVLLLDVKTNITISSLKTITRGISLNKSKENAICEQYREKMNIKTPSITQKVKNLSGGNQQKIALAKGLMTDPQVLILDEPTRGIDVGAKKEIYDLINDLKVKGQSVLMISSEMPEILGMSDRILVMGGGTIKGELSREDATQEKIMQIIMQ